MNTATGDDGRQSSQWAKACFFTTLNSDTMNIRAKRRSFTSDGNCRSPSSRQADRVAVAERLPSAPLSPFSSTKGALLSLSLPRRLRTLGARGKGLVVFVPLSWSLSGCGEDDSSDRRAEDEGAAEDILKLVL